MLEARRRQIASGLANAAKIKAELDRIAAERVGVLTKADAEGKQLIEEARAAAARVLAEETQNATTAGEQILDESARGRPSGTARACSPSSSARSAGWWCRRRRR